MRQRDIVTIVQFCLGTDAYRGRSIHALREALNPSDPRELCALFQLMHLSGLMATSPSGMEALPDGVRSEIEVSTAIDELYAERLVLELSELGTAFEDQAIWPIMLKGPALWGSTYVRFRDRRVEDVDLLFETRAEVVRARKVLLAKGFKHEPVPGDVGDGSRYELPPFSKQLTFRARGMPTEKIEGFVAKWGARRRLKLLRDGVLEIHSSIEVHKALYLLKDNRSPGLRFEDSVPWVILPSYRAMTMSCTLPYLSTKFWIDRGLGTDIKCVKLLGDIIRILRDATQLDIQESIRAAERWTVLTPYRCAIAWAGLLMPEVKLSGISPSDGGVVDGIAERAGIHISNAAARVQVSAPLNRDV